MRRNDLNETVHPEALADQPLQAMDKFSLPGRIPSRHCTTMAAISIPLGFSTENAHASPVLTNSSAEMLQILSPDFSAIDNDDIFLPANDHNPTFGEIANVLGVKPSVRGQDLTSFLGIVEVPDIILAPQKNYAGVAIRQNCALLVTNFDLNSRQRDAANYKRPGIRYFPSEPGSRPFRAKAIPRSDNTAGSTRSTVMPWWRGANLRRARPLPFRSSRPMHLA